MVGFLRSFVEDDVGATALEYGLIAALVSVTAIGVLSQMGGGLVNTYSTISSALVEALATT